MACAKALGLMEGAGICWGKPRVTGSWLARVNMEGDKVQEVGAARAIRALQATQRALVFLSGIMGSRGRDLNNGAPCSSAFEKIT